MVVFIPTNAQASVIIIRPVSNTVKHKVLQQIEVPAKVISVVQTTYTVVSGDTLSALSTQLDRSVAQLVGFNHISDPNLIYVGQVINIPPVTYVAPPIVIPPASVVQTSPVQDPAQEVTSAGVGGAFGDCVRARESGGNYNVMNSSGHYGAYQFSYGTWVEYGGNPADFGNAPPAEQDAVFSTAIARGGEGNWSPYDGC